MAKLAARSLGAFERMIEGDRPLRARPGQTIERPYRFAYPGIYKRPDVIAREAAERVSDEDPSMRRLFGVSRDDLFEIGKGRKGNLPGEIAGAAADPTGSAAADKVMTKRNAQRILDALAESEKHPALVHGMDPWYVMDPMYRRMESLMGPDMARQRYRQMNSLVGMASPGSDVGTEIARGTAANWLHTQGRFGDFEKFAGMPLGDARNIPGFPDDMRTVLGHPYHKTAQSPAMRKYIDTGAVDMASPKVPMYIEASGVPETGFQTRTPVGDAHWSRAVGLSDARSRPSGWQGSVSNPEMSALAPWWRDQIAGSMGLESVPVQARTWGLFSPQTGVKSKIGAPKLEILSMKIMETANRLGISPEEARDLVLQGGAYAGKADGGYVNLAGGGSPLEAYIRSRLPKNLSSQPMRRLQSMDYRRPVMAGSGRDIYQLGDESLVKLAKRPRGLYENSLEGLPAAEENLPKLRWRSDDNEMSVVELMDQNKAASHLYMQPLAQRYQHLAPVDDHGKTSIPNWMSIHRDDPMMRSMMEKKRLEKFLPMNLLGGDFFLVPDDHWALRHGRDKPTTPVLLDPGAMDYRITQPGFEQRQAWPFRNILSERISSMTPKKFRVSPEDLLGGRGSTDPRIMESYGIGRGTERFIGPRASHPPIKPPEEMSSGELADDLKSLLGNRYATPKDDQGTFGFAAGGAVDHQLRKMRERFAGGGVVRNWLRGVKGSNIDEALLRLKQRTIDTEADASARAKDPNHKNATEKWIDTNLANYLIKQHGTDADPLKEILGHPPAIKKISAAQVPAMWGAKNEAEDQAAIKAAPQWLQRMIEQDQPRHWSQQQYEKGKSNLGHRTDALMSGIEAFTMASDINSPDYYNNIFSPERKRQAAMHEERYQRRHTPPIELHDLDKQAYQGYYEPRFREVLDWMRQSGIPPERLNRVSVPDAVRGAKEWQAQMTKKAEAAAALKLSGDNAYKKYPNGWRWIEMGGEKAPVDGNHPDTAIAQQIGKQLGHCYQNPRECKEYLENGKLYSLIDPKGKAHATIESQQRDMNASVAARNPETEAAVQEWRRQYQAGTAEPENFPEWVKRHHPEVTGAQDINQIRGPQFKYEHDGKSYPEMMVNDEAKPYVHDLIRSGKWGNVQELEHAGLKKFNGYRNNGTEQSGVSHYMTPEEAKQFARYKYFAPGEKEESWLNEADWAKRAVDYDTQNSGASPALPSDRAYRNRLAQRRAENGDVRYEIPDDWKPQGFAVGGMVSPANFPKESPEQALEMAEHQLEILLHELGAAQDPQEQRSLQREVDRASILVARLRAQLGRGNLQALGPSAPAAASPDDPEDNNENDGALDMLGRFMDDDPEHDDLLSMLMQEFGQ